MGVVNMTPDSFSDGGRYYSPDAAIRHATTLVEEGADVLDLGGQSTRPGAQPVGTDEELKRVLPVLKNVRKQSDIWISIDTYRSNVAAACISEGADLINDVSSFRMDARMASVVGRENIPVVCMHFLESIHPMPTEIHYNDLFGEILEFFQETLRLADAAGIKSDQIVVDPGIGFGKLLQHNLQILNHLEFLQPLNKPILVGPSRKSFIGKITGLPPEERLDGSAAAAAVSVMHGAHIVRVHDIAFMRHLCDVLDQIVSS